LIARFDSVPIAGNSCVDEPFGNSMVAWTRPAANQKQVGLDLQRAPLIEAGIEGPVFQEMAKASPSS
jgi:hypothetical protein